MFFLALDYGFSLKNVSGVGGSGSGVYGFTDLWQPLRKGWFNDRLNGFVVGIWTKQILFKIPGLLGETGKLSYRVELL